MIVIGRLLQVASTGIIAFAISLLILAIQQKVWWAAFFNCGIIVANMVLILHQEKVIAMVKAGRNKNEH